MAGCTYVHARAYALACRGVCPPRMATKLRQKKKRLGAEGDEGRVEEEEEREYTGGGEEERARE